MRSELTIRFDYGWIVPWVTGHQGGITAIAGPDRLKLRSWVENRGEGFATVADFIVREGQKVPFTLVWHPFTEQAPAGLDAEGVIHDADAWWRAWSERSDGDPRNRDEAVVRSLLTLKALTYGPTGGIVAAPTTSIPEKIGGVRNWDYRFCWLRDATFTLLSLVNAGYLDEARDWRQWLLRAVAGRPDNLQIMYGLAGERRMTEFELPWLDGYEGSKPVRVGNAASEQFQLDVYGEIADALYQAHRHGLGALDDVWRMSKSILGFLDRGLEGARRRDLGGEGRAPPFHPLQGHGLGRLRSQGPRDRAVRLSRRGASSGGRPPAMPSSGKSARRDSTRRSTRSFSLMARNTSMRAC